MRPVMQAHPACRLRWLMADQLTSSGMSAAELLTECRHRLDDLDYAMKRRQWQRAAAIAADYSRLLTGLGDVEKSMAILDEMVQLDIKHRRCMRLLSGHMAAVCDSMEQLKKGQQAAQRSKAAAEAIFKR